MRPAYRPEQLDSCLLEFWFWFGRARWTLVVLKPPNHDRLFLQFVLYTLLVSRDVLAFWAVAKVLGFEGLTIDSGAASIGHVWRLAL